MPCEEEKEMASESDRGAQKSWSCWPRAERFLRTERRLPVAAGLGSKRTVEGQR